MSELALNLASQPEPRLVGAEQSPVVVIDEPLLSVDGLVQDCIASAAFSADAKLAYPGVRAPLPRRYGELLAPHLSRLIKQVYQSPGSSQCELIHQLYSLITLQPEKLQPLQCVPHTDTHHRHYFATVHYLGDGRHGGTGFFRHRPTGYERISEARYPYFVKTASAFMNDHGLPPARNINTSDDHFELIGEVPHRHNRLILYPGNLLHSGLIDPETDINGDPATGRLTANLFLFYR